MPRPDTDLTPAAFELPGDPDDEYDGDDENAGPSESFLHVNQGSSQPVASRSMYHLPTSEKLRGVANRIIFSRYYVLFYGVMMILSMVTVVLSLMSRHGCPPVAWHILEVVINALMVIEVGTRWIAYGKLGLISRPLIIWLKTQKYPLTLLNVIDLLLVLFCSVTLIVVFTSPCSDSSMSEENLDMILLVIRNGVQFLRIVNILRRSGHSIFKPPKPIDLSQARPSALDMDLDLSDEEAAAERSLVQAPVLPLHNGAGGGGRRTLAGEARYEVLYADEPESQESRGNGRNSADLRGRPERVGTGVKPGQGRDQLTEEDQEAWDRLG